MHPYAHVLNWIIVGDPIQAFTNNKWTTVDDKTVLRLIYDGVPERHFRKAKAAAFVTIGGIQVGWTKGLRVAPTRGSEYWVADYRVSDRHRRVWNDTQEEIAMLENGFVHASPEEANEHAAALVQISGIATRA